MLCLACNVVMKELQKPLMACICFGLRLKPVVKPFHDKPTTAGHRSGIAPLRRMPASRQVNWITCKDEVVAAIRCSEARVLTYC
jgi:hypothetical protein